MRLDPYLMFDGQCEAAFKFYEKTLGAQIKAMMPHAGSPAEEHAPPEWKNKILHAALSLGDFMLMGSDAPPGEYQQPKGFYVSLHVEQPADAERIFKALSENGQVHMPLAETFWAVRFGMLVDQFHVPWMINCSKPQ